MRKSIYQRKIEAVKEIAKAKRLLRGDVGEKIGIKQNTEDKIMRDLVKSKIIGKEHVNIKGYSRVQFFVKKDYKKNLEYILLKEKMKITQRKPIKEMSLNELFTELRRALRGQRKAEIIEPTNVDFWRRKKVFDYLLKHPKEHSTSQISKTLRIGFIRVQLALEHLKKKGFLQKRIIEGNQRRYSVKGDWHEDTSRMAHYNKMVELGRKQKDIFSKWDKRYNLPAMAAVISILRREGNEAITREEMRKELGKKFSQNVLTYAVMGLINEGLAEKKDKILRVFKARNQIIPGIILAKNHEKTEIYPDIKKIIKREIVERRFEKEKPMQYALADIKPTGGEKAIERLTKLKEERADLVRQIKADQKLGINPSFWEEQLGEIETKISGVKSVGKKVDKKLLKTARIISLLGRYGHPTGIGNKIGRGREYVETRLRKLEKEGIVKRGEKDGFVNYSIVNHLKCKEILKRAEKERIDLFKNKSNIEKSKIREEINYLLWNTRRRKTTIIYDQTVKSRKNLIKELVLFGVVTKKKNSRTLKVTYEIRMDNPKLKELRKIMGK